MLEYGPGNRCNLRRRLAFAEYDLREAFAKRPVVVDLGKSQVLERQVPELLQDLVATQPVLLELEQ